MKKNTKTVKRPVIMILGDEEIYYFSISDASRVMKEVFKMDTWTIESITSAISVSCRMPGRTVKGVKFRFPTEEEKKFALENIPFEKIILYNDQEELVFADANEAGEYLYNKFPGYYKTFYSARNGVYNGLRYPNWRTAKTYYVRKEVR